MTRLWQVTIQMIVYLSTVSLGIIYFLFTPFTQIDEMYNLSDKR